MLRTEQVNYFLFAEETKHAAIIKEEAAAEGSAWMKRTVSTREHYVSSWNTSRNQGSHFLTRGDAALLVNNVMITMSFSVFSFLSVRPDVFLHVSTSSTAHPHAGICWAQLKRWTMASWSWQLRRFLPIRAVNRQKLKQFSAWLWGTAA